MLEHKSFPSLPIVSNGCEALVSSYQNCYKAVIFVLQPPDSFPCSHCCPSTSVPMWQITHFLIAPSDCRINSIPLSETFKVFCSQASPDFPRTPLLPNGSTHCPLIVLKQLHLTFGDEYDIPGQDGVPEPHFPFDFSLAIPRSCSFSALAVSQPSFTNPEIM